MILTLKNVPEDMYPEVSIMPELKVYPKKLVSTTLELLLLLVMIYPVVKLTKSQTNV